MHSMPVEFWGQQGCQTSSSIFYTGRMYMTVCQGTYLKSSRAFSCPHLPSHSTTSIQFTWVLGIWAQLPMVVWQGLNLLNYPPNPFNLYIHISFLIIFVWVHMCRWPQRQKGCQTLQSLNYGTCELPNLSAEEIWSSARIITCFLPLSCLCSHLSVFKWLLSAIYFQRFF